MRIVRPSLVVMRGSFSDAAAPALAAAARAVWGSPETVAPPLDSPSGKARRWVVRAAVVLAAAGLSAPAIGQLTSWHVPLGVAYGLGGLQTLPVLLAPRLPLLGWRIATLGMALVVLLGVQSGQRWPWPATSCVAYLLLLFLLARVYERAVVVGAGVVTVLVLLLPAVWSVKAPGQVGLVTAAAVALVVLSLGDAQRGRRTAQRRLAEAEERGRRERARRAVVQERSRIARELHDVVAHHMSMIAIQAKAAPYKIPQLPEDARVTFAAIRGASTTALTEMRAIQGSAASDGRGNTPTDARC